MKQEMGWGAAAVLAVAAAVGISSRSAPVPKESTITAGREANAKATKTGRGPATQRKSATPGLPEKECSDLYELIQTFLLSDNITAPGFCSDIQRLSFGGNSAGSTPQDLQAKFIIATFPDPLHTHFSLLFDRFIEAIQEGAQDEGYSYDSSWLPWETEDPTLTFLEDQDTADERKKNREDQPGVLLFRALGDTNSPRQAYERGLFIFIVGEDPTDGVHRKQFENALAWIQTLQSRAQTPVAILGPTFSGSLPSMKELLVDPKNSALKPEWATFNQPLQIYSGSVSSKDDAEQFAKTAPVVFHSFVQDDSTALDRFCRYFHSNQHFDLQRLAILSEDETAYGGSVKESSLCPGASWFYYPRDISTLRAAYQKQSIFNSGAAQQTQVTQRNNLPADLADPEGKEHDTVRTYAGNQTPLSQEAQLLGIVAALRSHRSQYIALRSSNTLDPLFLANFLRRDYPEARVITLNSDLLFQRGQDALALGGVMTLSTYPLFPKERPWTARRSKDNSPLAQNTRAFPENSTEGTYIASRMLLRWLMYGADRTHPGCNLSPQEVTAGQLKEIFVPSIDCHAPKNESYIAIPDYAPPSWTGPPCAGCNSGDSCKPATWLAVITGSGSWPLAALNETTINHSIATYNWKSPFQALEASTDRHRDDPPISLDMKLLLFSLVGFSLFHAACCLGASFTAKPAFRAHFATPGVRHRLLMLIGGILIAFMALLAGWGCGVFSQEPGVPMNASRARSAMLVVWLISGLSIAINICVTRQLNDLSWSPRFSLIFRVHVFAFIGLLVAAIYAWAYQLETTLPLSARAFIYWRSMNVTSGVSPIVPFLILAVGLYLWFWYSLHGLALFGPDKPRLPSIADLVLEFKHPRDPSQDQRLNVLTMFSQECAANPTEKAAQPLGWRSTLAPLLLFFIFLAAAQWIVGTVPVRSLGVTRFASIFYLSVNFCIALMLGVAWQLMATWTNLRQLLVFLDRLALRRTLDALRGFSWGTVWRMGGNVLDVRYKLLSRQLEALTHLHTTLELLKTKHRLSTHEQNSVIKWRNAVEKCQRAGLEFAKWYAMNYCKPYASGMHSFEVFQQQIAETTGLLLSELLVPAWRAEKQSLVLIPSPGSGEEISRKLMPESTEEYVRNTEELVCLTYLGFVQNILGRIRTMALAGLFLFVAITLAVSSYPFDPRPALSGVLLVLFVVFGAVIVFVYADMHRDATLSHITNTNPGELGSEFWFKIVGFGAAPALGLITTIFPELSGFLLSWLQPGLASLK